MRGLSCGSTMTGNGQVKKLLQPILRYHPQNILLYVLTYLLTYSMELRSSWKANRFSASQEIPHILWNPMVHYRIHKCLLPVTILSQLDPVHNPTSHCLKDHLIIIIPSTPGSPKRSHSLRFPHHNPVYASLLPHKRYMPRPSDSSRFYHPQDWPGLIT